MVGSSRRVSDNVAGFAATVEVTSCGMHRFDARTATLLFWVFCFCASTIRAEMIAEMRGADFISKSVMTFI